MSKTAEVPRRPGTALLWLNIVIMLAPPVHLALVRGDVGMALLFFMGSSLLLIASVLFLNRAHAGEEEAGR